jgi:3-oxoacyl-[acyl-carrier protein] reductase
MPDNINNMNKPVAIITGANSGIGFAFAHALSAQHYRLCLVDIQLDSIQAALPASDQLMFYALDVRDASAWKNLTDSVVEKFGTIDYLVNFAGIVQPGFIYNVPVEDIDRHIDINTKGTLYGTHAVGAQMKKQGHGHIINISSLAGIAPVPGIALYSASKFAVRGFSLAAAHEYAPFGVTISVVCPDLVKTPMYDLELQYREETALVFSGSKKVLTPERVVAEILSVMKTKKREVTIPTSRGLLARLAGAWPWLADVVRDRLVKKGLRRIAELKGS